MLCRAMALLGFLHGALKVAFSYVAAVLVADRIERNHLCEVVFIAIFFFQRTVDICLSAIVIRVVLGIGRSATNASVRCFSW